MTDQGPGAIAEDAGAGAPGALKLPEALIPRLVCPGRPDLPLTRDGDRLVSGDGTRSFPIVAGTPVLINEANSVFEISDFVDAGGVTTMDLRDDAVRLDTPAKKLKDALLRLVPPKSRVVADFEASDALQTLLDDAPEAGILVIGAGDARFQIDADACIVYSDVALASDTQLIADAHDIPFADGSFDAVFAIAVLEHVADPFRCIFEIQRVLVPGGHVYSVTPFMQQVHMGRYDFTRFSAMGHRRAFRWFDEVRSGVANGPGMAVAWSIEYMLSSFSERHRTRSLLRLASRFVTWPFLLFDRFLAGKAGAYDCASAYYFFGRLRDAPISDREIVGRYRGMN